MPLQLNLTPTERVTLARRFWVKVVIGNADECWPWQASRNKKGYGKIGIKGHCMKSHRVAFYLALGTNAGEHAMHLCDNPPCCNPAHLKSGNALLNNQDMARKGRARSGISGLVGVKHGRAKLTDSDVLTIRNLIASGFTRRAIASQFGVRHGAIIKIEKGQTWRHV